MNAEFVDSNVVIYAHDAAAGKKRAQSEELLLRLLEEGRGALSTQVLSEFYWTVTRKLALTSQEAEGVLADFAQWTIHRPDHDDLIRAAGLQRRHKISWWDALIVNSAIELECGTLWTEDLAHGQRFGSLTVRNPFR